MNHTSSKYFQSVQCLRGVAALFVVFHHACFCFANSGYQPSLIAQHAGLREFGACGVDIFFAISGFVMVVTTATKLPAERSAGSFIMQRLIRIVPLYWIYTTLILLLLPLPFVFVNTKSHFTWDYILKSYLFIPAPNAIGVLHPLLDQGWTLVYELYFYLVFAAFLRLETGLAVACISAVFAALVCVGASNASPGSVGSFFTDSIVLEFCLGMCAGLLYLKVERPKTIVIFALFVASVAALAATILGPPRPDQRLVSWGIPAAGLLISSVWLDKKALVKNWPRSLLLFGDSSYSIYLTHGFVLLPCGTILKRLSIPVGIADIALLCICCICVLPGLTSYRFVEKPSIAGLKAALLPKGMPFGSKVIVLP